MADLLASRRKLLRVGAIGGLGAVGLAALAGCGETQIVTETKIQTVEVEKAVEKIVTKEVVKEVAVEKIVTQIVEKEKIVEKIVEKVVEVAPAKKKATELALTTVRFYGVEEDKIVFDKGFEIFKAKTGVTVNQTLAPGGGNDYYVKVLTQIAGGTPPDALYMHPEYMGNFAGKGAIIPIDEWVKRDGIDLTDYYDNILEYFRFPVRAKGAKLFVIPFYSGPSLTIYNKDLFVAAGIAEPKELNAKGEWTWEKIHEVAKQITTGAGGTKVFGFDSLTTTLKVLAPMIWNFGGDVWNADMTKGALHEAGAVEALQQYADLRIVDKVSPTPADAEGIQGGLSSGRIAISAWGIKGQVPSFNKAAFTKGMTNAPAGPKGQFVRNGPNGFAIMTTAKAQDEAWELMKFTAGPEFFALQNSIGSTLPMTRTLMKSPEFLASLAPWEDAAVYNKASEDDLALSIPATFNEIDKLTFRPALDIAFLGQKTVQQAMDEIAPKIEEYLAQNKKILAEYGY